MSVYLYDGQGLDADNMAIILSILKYVGLLNFLGLDWIVLGDWNLQHEVWADEWLEQVHGVLLFSETSTCHKSRLGT
eukprot:6559746-Pyramimonas_sp.AAC.1